MWQYRVVAHTKYFKHNDTRTLRVNLRNDEICQIAFHYVYNDDICRIWACNRYHNLQNFG